MYGVGGSHSQSVSSDASLLFSSTFKHPDGEVMKSRGFMNSDLYQHQHQQQQQCSGLMRYRSAPSSFFASLVDGFGGGSGCEDLLNPNPSSSSESEAIIARFMSSNGSAGDSESHDLQFPTAVKHETPENNQYSTSTSTSTQMIYQTSLDQHDLAIHSNSGSTHTNLDGLYNVASSTAMEMENPVQAKTNLIRQSSSPAGFFSNLTAENGFNVMRDVGNDTNGKASPISRLSDHINFSLGPSSCSMFMPQIAENGNERIETGSPENSHSGNGNSSNRYFIPSFQNDSVFTGLKRNRDGNEKKFSGFNALESQNGDCRNYTTGLTHHLSLPNTSAEVASVEKLLQFQQDSTPCKIRAKRGFATHPRSIAERKRRTRISERIRKLQELFPNMDKQTNTADMLDLAVEYIKDLQKQVETLTDTRAKCTCSSKQKQFSNPTV